MAHILKIIRGRRLKKKLKCYQCLKEIGLRQSETDNNPSRESSESTTSITWFTSWGKKITTWSAVENITWNSLIGFLGGVIFTYAFFIFFHLGVNISLRSTTYISALIGIAVSLGLTFSTEVRCYVLLLLPVIFSKQGRQALLAYALFLAFTGPARNTMHNMGVLSDSMNCEQEIVKKTFKQIAEIVKVPSKSIKESLWRIRDAIEKMVKNIKDIAIKLKRAIIVLLEVMKAGSEWIRHIVTLCNKRVGTPFRRCMKSFEVAILNCKARLGILDFMCHVVHVLKALCYAVKSLDFICLFPELESDRAVEVAYKKLRNFHNHMKELFFVSIELNHSYEFDTKATNTTKYLGKSILQRFSEKVEKLQSIVSVLGFLYGLLFIFLFVKAYYYKYKYLSSDQYDNIYINKYIIELDLQRALMDKETLLPLEPKERKKYGKPTAFRLLDCEKYRIAQSMFLLSLTSFKVLTFVAVDYCLFWILLTIYEVGHDALNEVEHSKFRIKVEGKGILGDFYRKLGRALEMPKSPFMHFTPLHCLPNPIKPDTRRYMQIGFLVILCWVLTLTEAYGLRLRNIIMSYYYPDRARERAAWLYNYILWTRGSFIRFARTEHQKKFGSCCAMPVETMTYTQKLLTKFPLLGHPLRKRRQKKCMLCGIPEQRPTLLKRCKTPDCPGRYCTKCFESSENICTICHHPIEYVDVSGISQEVDSSEEDLRFKEKNENFKCDSDSSEEIKKFKTSGGMQTREKFWKVEANTFPNYVERDDVNPEKAPLQQRLSALLEQFNSKTKLSVYKQIKSKLTEKINNLKRLRERKLATHTELIPLSFPSNSGQQNLNHRALREEIAARIVSFKEKKLKPQKKNSSIPRKTLSFQVGPVTEYSDDDLYPSRYFSYYFTGEEKGFGSFTPKSEISFSEEPSDDSNTFYI